MEALSIIPKKSVAKKQIVQAKKGTNIANHLLKSSQAFVNRFTNNPIVLREYDLLKNE